jgi:hypothetical protein
MENYVPPLPAALVRQVLALIELFVLAAQESAKAARKVYKERTRIRRGATLRPGAQTPLWNELARAAQEQLTRYGDKARLARILGVPRQRVDQYLRAQAACPDAERTLLLLAWVHARRNGGISAEGIVARDVPCPNSRLGLVARGAPRRSERPAFFVRLAVDSLRT